MGEAFITRRGGIGIDFSNCPYGVASIGTSTTNNGLYFPKPNNGGNYDPMDFSYAIIAKSNAGTTSSASDMIILKINKADQTLTKIPSIKGSVVMGDSLNNLEYAYRKTGGMHYPAIYSTTYGDIRVCGILIP